MGANNSNPLDQFRENVLSLSGFGGLVEVYLFVFGFLLILFNIPTLICLMRGKGAINAVECFGQSLISILALFTFFLMPYGILNGWHYFKRSIA